MANSLEMLDNYVTKMALGSSCSTYSNKLTIKVCFWLESQIHSTCTHLDLSLGTFFFNIEGINSSMDILMWVKEMSIEHHWSHNDGGSSFCGIWKCVKNQGVTRKFSFLTFCSIWN